MPVVSPGNRACVRCLWYIQERVSRSRIDLNEDKFTFLLNVV